MNIWMAQESVKVDASVFHPNPRNFAVVHAAAFSLAASGNRIILILLLELILMNWVCCSLSFSVYFNPNPNGCVQWTHKKERHTWFALNLNQNIKINTELYVTDVGLHLFCFQMRTHSIQTAQYTIDEQNIGWCSSEWGIQRSFTSRPMSGCEIPHDNSNAVPIHTSPWIKYSNILLGI